MDLGIGEMKIKIYTKHKQGEGLVFEKPAFVIDDLDDLLKTAHNKYGGNVLIEISLPHRPRSTGKRSQNHIIRGDCASISKQWIEHNKIYTPGFVHAMLKAFAVRDNYYPYVKIGGEIIPYSEADLSVEQATQFTGYIEKFADENNLWLIRMNEDGIPYKTVGGRTEEEMKNYGG